MLAIWRTKRALPKRSVGRTSEFDSVTEISVPLPADESAM